MPDDPKQSEPYQRGESRSSLGEVDLGVGIYQRYRPASNLVAAGFDIGAQASFFSFDRLPLLRQIQERWAIGKPPASASLMMRHAYTGDLFRRRRFVDKQGLTPGRIERTATPPDSLIPTIPISLEGTTASAPEAAEIHTDSNSVSSGSSIQRARHLNNPQPEMHHNLAGDSFGDLTSAPEQHDGLVPRAAEIARRRASDSTPSEQHGLAPSAAQTAHRKALDSAPSEQDMGVATPEERVEADVSGAAAGSLHDTSQSENGELQRPSNVDDSTSSHRDNVSTTAVARPIKPPTSIAVARQGEAFGVNLAGKFDPTSPVPLIQRPILARRKSSGSKETPPALPHQLGPSYETTRKFGEGIAEKYSSNPSAHTFQPSIVARAGTPTSAPTVEASRDLSGQDNTYAETPNASHGASLESVADVSFARNDAAIPAMPMRRDERPNVVNPGRLPTHVSHSPSTLQASRVTPVPGSTKDSAKGSFPVHDGSPSSDLSADLSDSGGDTTRNLAGEKLPGEYQSQGGWLSLKAGNVRQPSLVSPFGAALLHRYQDSAVVAAFESIVTLSQPKSNAPLVVHPSRRVPERTAKEVSRSDDAGATEEQVSLSRLPDSDSGQNEGAVQDTVAGRSLQESSDRYSGEYSSERTLVAGGVSILDPVNIGTAGLLARVHAGQTLDASRSESSSLVVSQPVAALPLVSRSRSMGAGETSQRDLQGRPIGVERVFSAHRAAQRPPGVAQGPAWHSGVPSDGLLPNLARIQRLPAPSITGSMAGTQSPEALPELTQLQAGHNTTTPAPDLSGLADRVYDLLVQRLASERQRRGI